MRKRVVVVVLAAALATGCAGGGNNQKINASADQAAATLTVVPTVDHPRILRQLARDEIDVDYRIGAEDLLDIHFFELEDLHKSQQVTVRVSEEGLVMLPLLGNVQAAGLTTGELRGDITKRLGEKYLTDPQVNVSIREYLSRKVAVLGAVKTPGVFRLRRNQSTLLEVLSLAGGPTEKAGRTLYLVRGRAQTPPAGSDLTASATTLTAAAPGTTVEPIDLEELLEKGRGELNHTVESGDVVNVPEAGMIYVTGHVNSAGAFALRKNVTVLQALSMAGGLKRSADPSAARVVRRVGAGKEIVPVDLKRIASGAASDVAMRENDVLDVPEDEARTFREDALKVFGSVFTIGLGL